MNAVAQALGGGIYPIGFAARLAHLQPKTARRWIEGYDYTHKGERRRSQPITYLGHPGGRKAEVVDFEQLLTLLLVRTFHRKGLSLQTIKKAAIRAREKYGKPNPFITKVFRTDGNKVLIDLDEQERVPGKERHLVDVLSDQHEFRRIVEPSLFKDVVFIDERAGQWWPLDPQHSVVLDPGKQFGAPHAAGTGIRTDVVAQVVAAEGRTITQLPPPRTGMASR